MNDSRFMLLLAHKKLRAVAVAVAADVAPLAVPPLAAAAAAVPFFFTTKLRTYCALSVCLSVFWSYPHRKIAST